MIYTWTFNTILAMDLFMLCGDFIHCFDWFYYCFALYFFFQNLFLKSVWLFSPWFIWTFFPTVTIGTEELTVFQCYSPWYITDTWYYYDTFPDVEDAPSWWFSRLGFSENWLNQQCKRQAVWKVNWTIPKVLNWSNFMLQSSSPGWFLQYLFFFLPLV